MRWLAKFVFFQIMGWKLESRFDTSIQKCVIIVAPHTSSWDFLIGILVRKILNIHIDFIAKKELFRPPFGWYFKMVGGSPLDRTSNQKKVDAIAEMFQKKQFSGWRCLQKERDKKTDRWKTGFYYTALKAEVPIVMVSFDFGKKMVRISEAFYPKNGLETDMTEIKSFYRGVQGKIPQNF